MSQGDIFQEAKPSVQPEPQTNGTTNSLNNIHNLLSSNTTTCESNVNPSQNNKLSKSNKSNNKSDKGKVKRKIRLIIPRKRKLKEIQSKNNANLNLNINGNQNINTTNTTNTNRQPQSQPQPQPQPPPQKKQKISIETSINNNNNNNNTYDELPTPTHSPLLHKPQPPSPSPSATPPLPISNNLDENNLDSNNDNNNNIANAMDIDTTLSSLPPPPPLQSISPEPLQRQPFSNLQSQLTTHFQWPTHNLDGKPYTHVCLQCGQGFMSQNALSGHKSKHRKAKQTAIRHHIIHNNNNNNRNNNQYYYPNNFKRQPQIISINNGKKKRKVDAHNQRDTNGNFPTHDKNGNLYTHLCDICGKGFSTGSALGGHRSVHKRMQKMGKIYNKLTNKHEYPSNYIHKNTNKNINKYKKNKLTQPMQPRSFMQRKNALPQLMNQRSASCSNLLSPKNNNIINEYSNLNNTEIMNKIMDKIEKLDVNKLFYECDNSKEYKLQITEHLSFEIIRNKIKENKYKSLQQDFMADLNKLFRFVFKVYNNSHERCKVALALKQFAYKQTMEAMAHQMASQSCSKLLDIGEDNTNDNGLTCLPMETYEKINDYEFFCDDEVLTQKMLCSKNKIICGGNCCNSLSKLGPYNIGEEKWESECKCRLLQMECTNECKCDPLTCLNRNISLNKYKKLSQAIREQQVFGIDQHTRMMVEKALPKQLKLIYNKENNNTNGKDGKSYFIEDILCPAINNYLFFIKQHSKYQSKYDPKLMLKSLEHEAKFMFTDVLRSILYNAQYVNKDDNICKIIIYLLKLILNMGMDQLTNEIYSIDRSKRRISFDEDSKENNCEYFLDLYLQSDLDVSGEDIICHEEFPIYTKGTGVVCIDKNGINLNEYIISFLGVVYSPWCWYEKDDRTRWLVKSRGAESQPEFFNIMMEKHKDDLNGYDLVFIDPSKKGNYGSRLSHSCTPNCISISMGVNNKYNIAVYASKNIKYGEELCFNYNSVTENEQEWQDAVCLCGTSNCNGQFLIYAGTQLYTEVLKKSHNVLHRTANLYNCNNISINEMKSILNRYSLSQNGVLLNIPLWIQQYAALICKYIDYEQIELPKELRNKAINHEKGYDQFISESAAIEESKGLKYVRLSNLVITLNKMNLFFRHPPNKNLMELPLFKLYDVRDLIDKIWYNNNSIISDLYLYITIYEGNQNIIIYKINEFRNKLRNPNNQTFELNKKYLLLLRDELLKLPPRLGAYHHTASDVLLFYAYTKYFFYFYPPYQGFQSRVFTYNELGYKSPTKYPSYPPPKKYAQQYVWGQLNYWERHTIESPDSSLSAERRGTISLPNIKCCYIKPTPTRTKHKKQYNYNIRKQVIKHLKYNNHKPWPTKWPFAFKNGSLYGSPWLDTYIDGPKNQRKKLDKLIDIMMNTKMIYTDGTYMTIESDLEDEKEKEKEQLIVINDTTTNNKNRNNSNDDNECKTNSTNPNRMSEETNPNRRRSNRLRGKAPKRSYVEPKIC